MKNDELVIKKVFNCNKRALFDAWSSASTMAKWFFAETSKVKDSTVECNFTTNGRWSVTMYFEDGTNSTLSGKYKSITRYSQIVFSWNSPIANDGLVELNFAEVSPNRTELKLVHSQFPSEESRQMHNQGWNACLANLVRYIDTNFSV